MNSKGTRNITRKIQVLNDKFQQIILKHERKRRLADINEDVMV